MSKQYKDKTCVYCTKPRRSSTRDHVIARGFFPLVDRDKIKLPIVPSCNECNNEKSNLETYLTSILPFGANPSEFGAELAQRATERLQKNNKLSMPVVRSLHELKNINLDRLPLPLDGIKLERLCQYIAQGLAFFHWKVLLPMDKCIIQYFSPSNSLLNELDNLINSEPSENRVTNEWTSNAFSYHGTQFIECTEFTLWKMSFYGFNIKGDSPESPMIDKVFVLTCPKNSPAVASRFSKYVNGSN